MDARAETSHGVLSFAQRLREKKRKSIKILAYCIYFIPSLQRGKKTVSLLYV